MAVSEDLRRQAHGPQQDVHQAVAQGHHDGPHHGVGQNQQGEVLPGLLFPALPHLFHYHGAAAGGQHPGHRRDEPDGRGREVDGRQGGGADEVGDKQAVHHGVERVEHRHDDGGKNKAQDVPSRHREVVRIQTGFHSASLPQFR